MFLKTCFARTDHLSNDEAYEGMSGVRQSCTGISRLKDRIIWYGFQVPALYTPGFLPAFPLVIVAICLATTAEESVNERRHHQFRPIPKSRVQYRIVRTDLESAKTQNSRCQLWAARSGTFSQESNGGCRRPIS